MSEINTDKEYKCKCGATMTYSEMARNAWASESNEGIEGLVGDMLNAFDNATDIFLDYTCECGRVYRVYFGVKATGMDVDDTYTDEEFEENN